MARKKAWEGRLNARLDTVFESLNSSLAVDRRMILEELAQDREWGRALAAAKVYTPTELSRLMKALDTVEKEATAGKFAFLPSDEDIHMAVERRLTELAGSAGEKLQTGRSRNDQVGTSFRMHLRERCAQLQENLRQVLKILTDVAERELHTAFPGLTHLQPAQVLSLGHYLMSAFWALERDLARLRSCLLRIDRMPLGSGALAGSTLPVDRVKLARDLGFARMTENSLDAVSDRDFVAELAFVLAQTLVHCSRYAEDLIIWASPLVGFVDLPDSLCTGSSLMPQKKNPDCLELIRGKSAGAIGLVSQMLALQKGLATSYNKDLQEDKEGLFNQLDTTIACVDVLGRVLEASTFNRERMTHALSDDLYATDVADYLVHKGMPFRKAHEVVGQLVRKSISTAVPLSKLPLTAYRALSPLFTADVFALYQPAASIARRQLAGGTAPDSVLAQLNAARALLRVSATARGAAAAAPVAGPRTKGRAAKAPARRPAKKKSRA